MKSVASGVASLIMTVAWLGGIAVSQGAIEGVAAIFLPPYAWFLFTRQIIATYAPELLIR
jgi:hypothetical protein